MILNGNTLRLGQRQRLSRWILGLRLHRSRSGIRRRSLRLAGDGGESGAGNDYEKQQTARSAH